MLVVVVLQHQQKQRVAAREKVLLGVHLSHSCKTKFHGFKSNYLCILCVNVNDCKDPYRSPLSFFYAQLLELENQHIR